MGIQLIKEGKGTKPGKLFGLKFYEYGIFNKEERDQLTKSYTEGKKSFHIQQMTNSKLLGKQYPPIRVNSISDWEIPGLAEKHNNEKEEFVRSIRKNNRNVQIYVKTKGNKKIITETVTEVIEEKPIEEFICKDCGFIGKSAQGLSVHQKRWCTHDK